MFADLDATIRSLMVKYAPLDLVEVDIGFDPPDREWSGRLSRPTINCFLYDIRENLQLRETNWEVTRGNGTVISRKAPMRYDVKYHVTVWARVVEDEHNLLWRTLSALARNPTIPSDVLENSMQDQPFDIPAWVGQPEHTPANPSDLWQALDNRIRPSLTYVVTVAMDPNMSYTTPVVLSRETRLNRLDQPQSPSQPVSPGPTAP